MIFAYFFKLRSFKTPNNQSSPSTGILKIFLKMASKVWDKVQTGVLLSYVGSVGIYLFGPYYLSELVVSSLKKLMALHFVEFIFVGMKLNNGDNNGIITHFVSTMLYGFIYWVPVFQDRSAKSV